MSAMQRIEAPDALKKGDEVVVYGKLRRMYHPEEFHTFTGNAGKVHSLPLAATVVSDGSGVWVKVPGVTGQFYAKSNHLFKRLPSAVLHAIPEGAIPEGGEDNGVVANQDGAVVVEASAEVEQVAEKPFYRYPADAIDNKGLQELRQAFALQRQRHDGVRDEPVFVYIDGYTNKNKRNFPLFTCDNARVVYAFVHEDGRAWVNSYTGCYGSMARGGEGDDQLTSGCAYILNYLVLPSGTKLPPEGRYFLQWLLNESPWAPLYITKDPQEAIDHGVLVDCKFPNNVVTSACIATRWTGERRQHMKLWDVLVKAGMSPHNAFWMTNFFSFVAGQVVFSPCHDHTPFGGYELSKEAYNNYLNNEFTSTNDLYSKLATYNDLYRQFGERAAMHNGPWGYAPFYDKLRMVYATSCNAIREESDKNPFGSDVKVRRVLNLAKLPEFVKGIQAVCDEFTNQKKD